MRSDRLRRLSGSTVDRTDEPVSAGQRLYGASSSEGVRQAPPYLYAVPYSPPVYAGQGLYGPPYLSPYTPKYGPPGPLGPGPYGAEDGMKTSVSGYRKPGGGARTANPTATGGGADSRGGNHVR